MASPTNVRFPDRVDRALGAHARKVGSKKSTVVVRAVDEWLRMETHPGIVFRAAVTGERRAALADGPEVWTVAESWLQHDPPERTLPTVAEATGLAPYQVERALAYWADHRDEIDDFLARHNAEHDDALAAWERRRALDSA
jgi:hypothetical protein